MPIPCVDVVVEKDAKVLLGFRKIRPYRRVWALPGGRIRKHEYPQDTVERNLHEIGLSAELEGFVGVFPVRFPRDPEKRYDITLCYRYTWKRGETSLASYIARQVRRFLPARVASLSPSKLAPQPERKRGRCRQESASPCRFSDSLLNNL
jgi:ADP-ribose pyrophosphatase YjhB (NUDIX family)